MGGDQLGSVGVDGRILLKWTLQNMLWRRKVDWSGSG